MIRLTSLAVILVTASFLQGCATHSAQTAAAVQSTAQPIAPAASLAPAPSLAAVVSPAAGQPGTQSGIAVQHVAHMTEVPVEKNAPSLEGHPLTSVVVTQCNLIVAVYMTMQDGRLMRFDSTANVPADQLLQMAYSATRSERVEVDCNQNSGAVGYERHDPV